MTIEERLERVEKQNRRMKWGMTVICMVAAGAFVLGQAAPDAVPDVIRAKRFEVVNEAGWAVVRLMSWKHGGWIETQNQQRGLFFVVAATDDGSGMLYTYDGEGNESVMLGTTATGGMLTTFNANGKELVALGSTVVGGVLETYNAEGKKLVRIASSLDGGNGALVTYNAEGKMLVSLASMKDGTGGSLTTYNAEGKELVALNSVGSDDVMNGTGAVSVFDPTGRTRRGMLTTRP